MYLHPMLAEDFGGLYRFFFSLWLALSFLCAIGLFAGYRGHWSTLLLSGPAILVSGLTSLTLLQSPSGVLPIFAVTTPIPFLLGMTGVVLWFYRNRTKFHTMFNAAFDPTGRRVIFYVCLACLLILVLTIVIASGS